MEKKEKKKLYANLGYPLEYSKYDLINDSYSSNEVTSFDRPEPFLSRDVYSWYGLYQQI